jgi:hypothetical protein
MRLQRARASLRRALTGELRGRAWGYLVDFRGGGVMDQSQQRACSFCGKPHDQVRRLIAGPNGVHICDACVAVCNDLIAKHEGRPAG